MPRPSVRRGSPLRLGANWDGNGVNFAVFSESATSIDLCLFDHPQGRERTRIRMPETSAHVFHGYVRGLEPGQLYGYRAHGPYDPTRGLRFNPNKLLVDPYARAIAGDVDFSGPIHAYVPGGDGAGREDLVRDDRDDAESIPKSVVVDDSFPWGSDAPPQIPWPDTVIYELHVRGFSVRHPDIEAALRGKYAALASPAAIKHFKSLGVTSIELMPVHHSIDDGFLRGRGLRNYWGYNTLGYFAPDSRFSGSGDRGGQVREFKAMVKALHHEGIEVILDVVYNHTCEGNHLGPTLSLRGFDNRAYYRLVGDDPRYYLDYTGTGNTLDMMHPQTLKLVMDSLRYWVTEMHVDGFRFDLASTLARESHSVDRLSAFFDIIHQDPILSSTKLIAEPWDVGEGGYQVGNFPLLWTEWNGRYRDSVRRFWSGYDLHVRELASRLTGSSDLYSADGRRPYASINFVTAHDGFTLHDLVSYNDKHNEANGEQNRDGTNDNASWNCGVEGETDDEAILELRELQKRNYLVTLFLSQGVPMLVAGDEMGRTQHGNNNAYCQDNEISWLDWSLDDRRRPLIEFARRVIAFRRAHPAFRRRRFFRGIHPRDPALKDLAWLRPDGEEMTREDWESPRRAMAFLIAGDGIPTLDDECKPVIDDDVMVLMNGDPEPRAFRIPEPALGATWEKVLDTAAPAGFAEPAPNQGSRAETALEVGLEAQREEVVVQARSIIVMRSQLAPTRATAVELAGPLSLRTQS